MQLILNTKNRIFQFFRKEKNFFDRYSELKFFNDYTIVERQTCCSEHTGKLIDKEKRFIRPYVQKMIPK